MKYAMVVYRKAAFIFGMPSVLVVIYIATSMRYITFPEIMQTMTASITNVIYLSSFDSLSVRTAKTDIIDHLFFDYFFWTFARAVITSSPMDGAYSS